MKVKSCEGAVIVESSWATSFVWLLVALTLLANAIQAKDINRILNGFIKYYRFKKIYRTNGVTDISTYH